MSLLFAIVAAVGSLVVAAPTNIPDDGIHLSVRAPLRFQTVGNSGVSAQQMFLGTANKIYVVDKTQNNPLKVSGHPAWASEYTISSNGVRALNVTTNTLCAGGASLGDGRWINVGGNQGVTKGGASGGGPGSTPPYYGGPPYYDYDGGYGVRLLRPCGDSSCQWVDNPDNYLKSRRWYPTVEPLDDGSVIIVGGDMWGGYVNTASQNNPTYEFFPSRGDRITLRLLQNTLPANLYPLTWLLPSGKLLIQANWGTALLDYHNGAEQTLPNIPSAVRSYPASAGTVMLPLTPANGYKATILFCGGQNINNWTPSSSLVNKPASASCVSITPDVSTAWKHETSLPQGRTMGNMILLPDGKILLVNGAGVGTAGYGGEKFSFGGSYATNPRRTPVIYDPLTKKWSSAGLGSSGISRMYHSSAILLPDGSIFVGGSNPHADVTYNTQYPTEYRTEKFYPGYFGRTRPAPKGLPSGLGYGGATWDVTLRGSDLQGLGAKGAATKSMVNVIRTGFSTHGLNMGQRYLQLQNTYTVNRDGSLTLHISQMPPNPALFAPGPAVLHVVVNGVPSIGKVILVGGGFIGRQNVQEAAALPPNQG